MSKRYTLRIAKEHLKFACAHMTVFSKTHKEPLHGHNYRVTVTVDYEPRSVTDFVDVAEIKGVLGKLCRAWDERVLLAAQNPYFEKLASDVLGGFAFRLCGKYYCLPEDEVVVLPITNITIEELSFYLGTLFIEIVAKEPWYGMLSQVVVAVEESAGQSASVSFPLKRV